MVGFLVAIDGNNEIQIKNMRGGSSDVLRDGECRASDTSWCMDGL